MSTETKTETTITINHQAQQVIRDMQHHADAITRAWAHTPERGTKARETLLHVITNMLTGSDTGVWRDDKLGLYTVSSIHVGIVFFREHRDVAMAHPDDIDMSYGSVFTGRYCMTVIERDGERPVYCAQPFTWRGNEDGGTRTCEGHDAGPVTMPVPGTWSAHS